MHCNPLYAYNTLSGAKTIPSDNKLHAAYCKELQIDAEALALQDGSSATDFVKQYSVTLANIAAYKKVFIGNTQARLNSINAANNDDKRSVLWKRINEQISNTTIGAMQLTKPKHKGVHKPLTLELPEQEFEHEPEHEPEHGPEGGLEQAAAAAAGGGDSGVGAAIAAIVNPSGAGQMGGQMGVAEQMSDPVCGECVLASAATALSQTVFQLDRKAVLRHGKSLGSCGQLPRRNTSTHLSRKHCPNSMKDDPVYYVGMTANAKKQQHKVVSERVRVLTRHMHRDLDKCDYLS
jgi:hypothetical protein